MDADKLAKAQNAVLDLIIRESEKDTQIGKTANLILSSTGFLKLKADSDKISESA